MVLPHPLTRRVRDIAAGLLVCLLVLLVTASGPLAQSEPLRVGLHESPPFVIVKEDGYAGLAVDLWTQVAGELGYEYEYQPFETVKEMVNATAAGNIDVAVSNLTITEARAALIEFTQPWYDSGLRIMVNETSGTKLANIWAGLRDSGFLRAYAWLAFAILVSALCFTFFDRRFDKDFPKKFTDGFGESFYTVMTVATSGKPPKRKNLFGWLGRVWQGLWLVVGVMVVAFVTSSVTSVMTTLSIRNSIRGLSDLPGLDVGVVEGSSAETFANAAGLTTIPYVSISASAQALLDGDIEAIIGDKPVLEYYVRDHARDPLRVVGPILSPEKYGFGLPPDSPLRQPITVEVVGAQEDGELAEMAARYFGRPR